MVTPLTTTGTTTETTSEFKAPESIEDVQNLLSEQVYITDRALAVPIFLAMKLQRPLFLEGEAGVGKTEIARALATGLNTKLIRLQCYEGLDVNQAVYEWNHARQVLEIRLMEAAGQVDRETASADLFSENFLIKRPLLQAIDDAQERPPVLLIDELDRSDEEFEGFLLELLGDYQITIPSWAPTRLHIRPSSSSPPTAPARFTTHLSGAASTTGSTTPTTRKSSR